MTKKSKQKPGMSDNKALVSIGGFILGVLSVGSNLYDTSSGSFLTTPNGADSSRAMQTGFFLVVMAVLYYLHTAFTFDDARLANTLYYVSLGILYVLSLRGLWSAWLG